MNVGPFQLLIIALVLLLLFGRGRISATLGDFGRGVKSFRKNLADEKAEPVALSVTEAIPNPADK